MAGDELSRVEVAFGSGRSRLAALLALAVLGVVVYVGVSGRLESPTPPSGPATQAPQGTPSRGPTAQLGLYVSDGYRARQAGDYGVVVSWPMNGGQASTSVSLVQVERGVLSAQYQVTLPDEPTWVSIELVQFGSADTNDDIVIGTWKTQIAADSSGSLIDFSTPPAIDASDLPLLGRAGYRLQSALTTSGSSHTLGFTVSADRVDVLSPGEIYEMHMTGEGYDIGGSLVQLDFGHLRLSRTWPSDFPRQTQLELLLVDTAISQLAAPQLVGTWPLHVQPARRVPLSGVVILDESVAPIPAISQLADGGYHVLVTETVDANGIRLTCDVYASSTRASSDPVTTLPTR